MSININLVSDKPEFTNFFSQSVVLPERAEIVMNKANMNIPLVKVVGVNVPKIELADRTDFCLVVLLDGIDLNITWRDLYNAHTALASLDVDNGISENNYFSGNYQYLPNYPTIYLSLLPLPISYLKKLNFMDVVAKAINTKALFYEVKNEANYEVLDQSQVFDTDGTSEIVQDLAGNVLIVQNMMNGIQTANTLIATYAPQKQVSNTLTAVNIAGGDSVGWVIAGNQLTSAATVSQAWYNDPEGIDINGGWYELRVDMTAGANGSLMATGFSFEGVGTGAAGDEYLAQAFYQPEVLDVGIQFEKDAVGNTLYKIIDGNEQYVYYDNAAAIEVVTTKPIFKPSSAKHLFQPADAFYLQIQRGSLYNGTNEFIVNIYQGQPGLGLDNANTKRIHTSRLTLNNAGVVPNLGFMCNANASNVFSNIQHIARTTQTDEQANHINSLLGQYYTGTLTVVPIIQDVLVANTRVKQRNLWSAYGYSTLDINSTAPNGRDFTSFVRSDRGLALERKTNFTSSNCIVQFHLGKTAISDLYNFNVGTTGISVDENNGLSDLPQEFKVKIRNMPVKAFQGSFITDKTYSNTHGGEERVVGTIPIPYPLNEDSGQIDIKYEPFNLTYRPLNNVEPFMFNKLDVDIDFLDFNTNQRKSFSSVNGHLTVDINVRQGAAEPKLKNNMRPV